MAFQFSEEKIKDRIQFENPWWEDGEIDPRFRNLKQRGYFNPFLKLVEETEVKRAVVLMGPRRVGKTVMIYHTIQELIKKGIPAENICFISLDTPIYDGSLLENLLTLFMEIHKHKKSSSLFVIFDEIQYFKNWEVHLKSLVDSYHHIKFVVSGSAAAALKLKSDESGAGRFTDFILPPLTFAEYLVITDKLKEIKKIKEDKLDTRLNDELINYINFGGYPEVSLSKEIQKNLNRYVLNDIVEKVLLKDIPGLYGIQDAQELKSFFNYLAFHTGQEFSIDGLASKSGVAKNTIKKYIRYLEAAFLIKKLNRIDQKAKVFKREVAFKIYLTNPSLRSALFSPISSDDPLFGHLVENAVFSQILHANINTLYYARWDKGEINFVTLNNLQKTQHVLEVKWSNKAISNHAELKQLISFCKKHKPETIIVTTKDVAEEKNIDGINILFLPVAQYCLAYSDLFHKAINEIQSLPIPPHSQFSPEL